MEQQVWNSKGFCCFFLYFESKHKQRHQRHVWGQFSISRYKETAMEFCHRFGAPTLSPGILTQPLESCQRKSAADISICPVSAEVESRIHLWHLHALWVFNHSFEFLHNRRNMQSTFFEEEPKWAQIVMKADHGLTCTGGQFPASLTFCRYLLLNSKQILYHFHWKYLSSRLLLKHVFR
jgi:hypothetical protein